MKKIKINLNSYENAKKFNLITNSFDCDIDVIKDRYIIDGKSLMGLFTLDLTQNIYVQIISEDEYEINEFVGAIKEFVVE